MAYRKTGWRFWVPTVSSAIGFLVGLSILICFTTAFKNFHVAAWGGTSGLLAGLTCAMHVAVRYDHAAKIKPTTFHGFMIMGVLGFLTGFGVFIGYLVKGIIEKETGVKVQGSFIVTVWGFLMFKWGMLLFLHGKDYKKGVTRERAGLFSSIQA